MQSENAWWLLIKMTTDSILNILSDIRQVVCFRKNGTATHALPTPVGYLTAFFGNISLCVIASVISTGNPGVFAFPRMPTEPVTVKPCNRPGRRWPLPWPFWPAWCIPLACSGRHQARIRNSRREVRGRSSEPYSVATALHVEGCR